MTPTLAGRLQTRLALSLIIGVPLALLAAALLDGLVLGDALRGLAAITVLGLGWDLLHQALQERRRDRDWPRLFTLLSWAPEAAASWLVLRAVDAAAPLVSHLVFFTVVWGGLLAARAALVPVLLPRWRHQGQRLAGTLPTARPATGSTAVPATAPATPSRLSLGTYLPGLWAGQRQFAALALVVGVVGAFLFLTPLLDRDARTTPVADARPAIGVPAADGDPADAARPARGAGDAKAGAKPHHGGKARSWDTHQRVRPTSIEFPAARLTASVGRTRVSSSGVLVAPDAAKAAWYGQGAAPGQRGPAVLIGSVDGVFSGLDRAKPGQSVRIARADGSQVFFTVDRVTEVDARSFPTRKVYGASSDPLLRLVGYDDSSGRNTIVFARAVMLVQSPTDH